MTMTAERIEVQEVASNDHGNRRVYREIDPTIVGMRAGFADHLWKKVMRGFEDVEQETECCETYSDRFFMDRYRELKERTANGKKKMPWLYT